ncbi:MAG: hypothetical protein CMJ24_06615 [Phycisphaerae bacterium]|nr:hypothetical protein [Phycisphaerae bacterium]|tara:strand:+ start:489 stop:1061 length:573 start_codon:yes stop_codon:yes gene_type:complete
MLKFLMTVLFASSMLLGCDGERSEEPAETTAPAAVAIPADTFLTSRPTDAQDLLAVKNTAAIGDDVTFLARVGGRVKPFVESQAIFVAADPSLKSCEIISDDDHCTVPWDYCCEDGQLLREGMATIRIVDAEGRPIRMNANGAGGLEPAKYIVVRGTVSDRNDEGLFIVDASGIWVGGKPTFKEPRKGSM